MSSVYIHELPKWPKFHWHTEGLSLLLADVRHGQGRLLGRMQSLGFSVRDEALLQTLTQDVVKSSEIEGERLDQAQVRSSIARRLGMDTGTLPASDRHVEGLVEMMLDAVRHFDQPLTEDRLFGWHAAMFPSGRSGLAKITTGAWRTDSYGPMQVLSGPIGREKVHFEAPAAKVIPEQMKLFLAWFNGDQGLDPVLKAGLAHLWFVTLHPFDDGNGRIGRAIADMALARAERSAQRFYSLSSQIRAERADYYHALEHAQKGSLEITGWLDWFLGCLQRAIENSENLLGGVLRKAQFWERTHGLSLNKRQSAMLNRLLDGFEGHLTTSKWAKLAKCSQDTAYRDILDLVEQKLLKRNEEGGRSTHYSLLME